MLYAVCKAIIDSVREWLAQARRVRIVGGGRALADRVRAEIRRRTGKPDADPRREGSGEGGDDGRR